ncbi:MAG: amidohydrolase family protein [Gammaproteobacteria bacterium]
MYNEKIIDTHMHLWDLKNNYPWLMNNAAPLITLGGNYDKLKQTFLVKDYVALTKNQNIAKSIHVEAFGFEGNPVLETQWLQKQADQFGFPHGIVARAELHDPDVKSILKQHCQYPNVRGIRMALNYHPGLNLQIADRGDYLRDKEWRKGFALLQNYNLVFDLQVFDNQIEDAASLAKEFPNTHIIIEHFGWPLDISENGFNLWYQRMALIAENKNVFMKLSAIGWVFKQADLNVIKKYISSAIELFGIDRCMFGSNFPPDSMFYNFDELVNVFKQIFMVYSAADQHKLFYGNAEKIYRLE